MWWRLQQISGVALETLGRLPGGRFPWGLLAWFSLVITIIALMVLRITTKPAWVVRARNRALARLMEFRLYQHELASVVFIFGRVLAAIGGYLWLWLAPLTILTLVLWPVLAQACLRFHYRPFRVGEPIQIKAFVREADDLRAITLEWPEEAGLEMTGAPFRSVSEREIVWQLRAREAGKIPLRLAADGAVTAETNLVIGEEPWERVSPLSVAADRVVWGEPLAEAPWPAGARIERMKVEYPRRIWRLGSVRIHWILACFMLCMLMGLALKPALGVEF